ncbi:hypothetical protein [Legionella rowbothamii]|nr:hypothetical protein [Legionella rowbothamii]
MNKNENGRAQQNPQDQEGSQGQKKPDQEQKKPVQEQKNERSGQGTNR